MAGLEFCLRWPTATSSGSIVLILPPGRSRGSKSPLGRWGSWLDKKSHRLQVWPSRTKEALDKLRRVKVLLGIVHSHLHPGPRGQKGSSHVELSRSSNELQSLCDQGHLDKAMDVLLCMGQQGQIPSLAMYRSLLKACSQKKALARAKQVYSQLVLDGFEYSWSLSEYVVSVLVKCGGLEDALQVFHRLPQRTVFSWTAVISGYTTSREGHKALRMYKLMVDEGVEPNRYTFLSLLKACSSIPDLEEGKRIHAEVRKYKCDSDSLVSNCLVGMYGKCGSLEDARNVFDEMLQRDVVSWNSMLTSYAQQGYPDKALQLYVKMKQEGVCPSNRTYVSALQACGMIAEKEASIVEDGRPTKVKSLERGRAIHVDVEKNGYGADVYVGNTLVSMYGKCGSIEDAQAVFCGLAQPNVVSCNALLAAYVGQGQGEKAVQLYDYMREEGISPDPWTFVSALQACVWLEEKEGRLGDVLSSGRRFLEKGKQIHADAQKKCQKLDVFIGSTLISMYGRFGNISDARKVFDGLCQHDVLVWNLMLAAYVEQGHAEEALQLYEAMWAEGISPDNRSFLNGIQACSMLSEMEDNTFMDIKSCKEAILQKGKAVHAAICKKGYDSDVFLGSSLISMYGKLGCLADAQHVFDGLSQRDVVAWTVMVTIYVEQCQAEQAFKLYEQMQEEGVNPNERTFVSMLQACVMLGDRECETFVAGCPKALEKGKVMHAEARRRGYDSQLYVCNALITMYAKCRSIVDAENIFDGLYQRDVVTWSSMLASHVEQRQSFKALELYERFLEEGGSPNEHTFVSAFQACGMAAEKDDEPVLNGQLSNVGSLQLAKALHAAAFMKGYGTNVIVGSTLVSLYGKCRSLADTQNVFDGCMQWDVVAWTALMTTYVQKGKVEKALELFERMWAEDVSPNDVTIVTALQACGLLAEEEADAMVYGQPTKVESLGKVKALHAESCKKGLKADIFVCSTLVRLYGQCGSIVDARNVLDGLPAKDVVVWNAMLAAYVKQGQGEEALQLYRQMGDECASVDESTIVWVLQACSSAGSLGTVRQIHNTVVSSGNDQDSFIASSLISAYGRCASIVDAQTVFDAQTKADVVVWNALIAGYARVGGVEASLKCYEKMGLAGVKPNGVTFLSLFCACSHAGLVEKGVEYFESMSRDHGINPNIDHYVSMADLFGRAGCFTRIEDLLSKMPMQPNLAMWLCVLGACQKHGNVGMGEQAFECAVSLQPKHSAAYALLSNIYCEAGLWDRAEEVKSLIGKRGAWKKHPGQTWIEHRHGVETFLVGEHQHQPSYELLRNRGLQLSHGSR